MTETADLRQLTPNGAVRRDVVTDRGTFATLVVEPGGSPRATALLVPGYTGSKEDFAPIYDPLAEACYRVIGLDQRGQYQSAGDDDPALYSVDSLGADIIAVAETFGVPVHLLGHSFGGLTTRAAVIGQPRAFASLTLLATGPSKLDGQRRTVVELAAPMLPTRPLTEIYDLGQQINAQDPSFVAPDEPSSMLPCPPSAGRSAAGWRFSSGCWMDTSSLSARCCCSVARLATCTGADESS